MPETVRIADHMPALYGAAEAASAKGRNRFRAFTAGALILLIVASLGGSVEDAWAGWISAAAFLAGTVLTTVWMRRFYENEWYDGRAAAESAKSLTFKYAVGGEPYGVDNPRAKDAYAGALAGIVAQLGRAGSSLQPSADLPDLRALDELRRASFSDRKAAYREQRIEEQHRWYEKRAGEHRDAARRWQRVVIALNCAGFVGAVLKGLGVTHFDLLSLFATLAASVTAWLSALDHRRIARAYEFAALDLAAVLTRLGGTTEGDWKSFVADAEQTMSREHTMWRARRRDED